MKPSLQREQRLYDALKRISKYMNPEELRRVSEKKYGLDGDEAIEMAYENVLNEARSAIKGLRRPEPPPPPPLVVEFLVVPARNAGVSASDAAASGSLPQPAKETGE